MHELSTGVLDRIMNGEEVDKPVFQILGHKKLASNTSGERYRLLLSDGIKSNSFTMLATQLNDMITQNKLSEHSIVRINRYALSMVNNGGTQRRVMVILDVEVLTPGAQIGKALGNVKVENGRVEESVPPAVPQRSSEVTSRPTPPAAQAPPPTRAPPAQKQTSNLNDSITNGVNVTPIAALSPYQNRWVIKVRVTNKSAVRTWSNSRGEGKLFSMDLVDESGEIRCTGFREAVDKFYDLIEIGGVYYISKCQLKPANKTFNHLRNDYEMTIGNDTEIVPCHEETSDIPTLSFNFVPIDSIESRPKDDLIDVLGIVRSASDVQTLVTKATNRELKKRDVVIVDDSNASITLTMWGQQAEDFDSSNNPVVAVKAAKIGEFQGSKNLSLLVASVLQKNPDLPEVHKLIGWYKNIGQDQDFKSISKVTGIGGANMNGPWLTLKEAQEKTTGQLQTVNAYVTKATINLIRTQNALYKSCPTQGCKKKVVDLSNGMFRCEKCNQEFPNFQYRLLLGCHLVDWTDNIWATAFSDQGETILHMTADELGLLHEQDENVYNEKIGEATFQSFIFKIQVRQENYNDEMRLKSTIAVVQPINYKTYNEHLLSKIKELAGITKA